MLAFGALSAITAVAAVGLFTTAPRVWYHRARLQSLHAYEAVIVAPNDHWLTPRYWRWRILERGRSQEQQLMLRGMLLHEHVEALVGLGYYERREFDLEEPWSPLLESPDWLVRLMLKTGQDSATNQYRDWPQIAVVRSPSNTITVRITAPVPVVREWQRTLGKQGNIVDQARRAVEPNESHRSAPGVAR